MDIISMIMSQNQGREPLAKTETKKITWDGNTTGRESFIFPDTDLTFVKIGDSTDYNSITSVSVSLTIGQKTSVIEISGADLIWNDLDEAVTLESPFEDIGIPILMLILPSDTEGLGTKGAYTIDWTSEPNRCYVSQIVTEVIHPLPDWAIPQIPASKLPGAVLPVVELETEPTAEGTPLTEAEAAAIDALNGKPCIVVFNCVFGNFTSRFEAYASCTIVNGVIAQYETSRLLVLGGQLLLANEDG